eukprot:SAG11_NODE_2285_length_3571_cov_2.005184_5_plen_99_part_00
MQMRLSLGGWDALGEDLAAMPPSFWTEAAWIDECFRNDTGRCGCCAVCPAMDAQGPCPAHLSSDSAPNRGAHRCDWSGLPPLVQENCHLFGRLAVAAR